MHVRVDQKMKNEKHTCAFRLVGALDARAISIKHLIKAELSRGYQS